MNDTSHDLTISRHVNAPRAVVWKAWSAPEHLEKWWCPRPWQAEVQDFAFHAGGAFDVLMHGPDGEKNPNPGAFLEVVPQERIVFTTTLTGGWRPTTPWLALTAFITLADAEGGTRYTARVLHRNKEDAQRHEEMGFEEGWGTCIGQLDEYALTLR